MILALAAACTLSASNRAVVERTFAAWSYVSHDLLQLPTKQPPLIILVDRRCTYTFRPARSGRFLLEGTRVGMTAQAHGDSVTLPTGARLPIAGMAFTSLYGVDDKAYFYATLPDVWKADPRYRDDPEDWATFLTPVMLHELTHTRQLLAIMKSLEPAGRALKTSDMDDDMIQRRYQSDTAFTSSVLHERDLLFAAAQERDVMRRLASVRQALNLRRARHAHYFTGADSAYAAIETRFIDMEGVAQWAAFGYVRQHPRAGETPAALVDRFRNNRKWWSQEYGLALYLALDATVPGWQRDVFPPRLRSALDLLEGIADR
jgi:hypothetical protein